MKTTDKPLAAVRESGISAIPEPVFKQRINYPDSPEMLSTIKGDHVMKDSFLKYLSAAWILLMILGGTASAAPIEITGVGTTDEDGVALMNAIIGTNITSPNLIQFNSNAGNFFGIETYQAGTFTDGAETIGIDSGIILSTGSATDVPGNTPQSVEVLGKPSPTGNPWNIPWVDVGNVTDYQYLEDLVEDDLDIEIEIYDPNILEFEFTLPPFDEPDQTYDLHLNYVFASEEYIDYVGNVYNDVFGFFIDGVNYATLDNGSVISVNNINPVSNSEFYLNNVSGFYPLDEDDTTWDPDPDRPIDSLNLDIEPDGLTTVLSLNAVGFTPGTHTMRLAIGDVSDPNLDSAVFIQTASFTATPTIPEPSTMILFGSGLIGLAAFLYNKKKKR